MSPTRKLQLNNRKVPTAHIKFYPKLALSSRLVGDN